MPLFPNLPFLLRGLTRLHTIRRSNWPIAVFFLGRIFFLYLTATLEYLFVSARIRRTTVQHPPVFILGHHRSGTTFLHKLLACDSQFGFINTYDVLFPYAGWWTERWFKPFLQRIFQVLKFKNPHFNDYLFHLDDPLEEDIYTLAAGSEYSAFWGDVFAGQRPEISDAMIFFKPAGAEKAWSEVNTYVVQKFTWKCQGKRFLSKNPPHTGRIATLLRQFPEARFVYLQRNPYQVFYSTFHLWKRTIERHYLLEKLDDAQIRDLVFNYYEQLIDCYEQQKSLIPPRNLVEIRYEDLKKDPLGQLRKAYDHLRLPGFDAAAPAIQARLDAEKTYRTYPYQYDATLQTAIYKRWKRFIDAGGYQPLS